MNVLTIECSPEDRASLDRLSAALERLASVLERKDAPTPDPLLGQLAKTLASVPDPVAPAVPEPAPVVEPDPAPPISLAEFQKALSIRCAESAETKAKVRQLLNEYAVSASAVPEDKRAEVLSRLAAL